MATRGHGSEGYILYNIGRSYLVATSPKPPARGEVEAALGASGDVVELEIAIAIHPGAPHDHIVGLAVWGDERVHLPCLP